MAIHTLLVLMLLAAVVSGCVTYPSYGETRGHLTHASVRKPSPHDDGLRTRSPSVTSGVTTAHMVQWGVEIMRRGLTRRHGGA
jgi:hypothetical protein